MNGINKLRCIMWFELFICILMILFFLYDTDKFVQFCSLFLAMMSMSIAFHYYIKILGLKEGDLK